MWMLKLNWEWPVLTFRKPTRWGISFASEFWLTRMTKKEIFLPKDWIWQKRIWKISINLRNRSAQIITSQPNHAPRSPIAAPAKKKLPLSAFTKVSQMPRWMIASKLTKFLLGLRFLQKFWDLKISGRGSTPDLCMILFRCSKDKTLKTRWDTKRGITVTNITPNLAVQPSRPLVELKIILQPLQPVGQHLLQRHLSFQIMPSFIIIQIITFIFITPCNPNHKRKELPLP